ncbi:MAG: [Fe-Fe] hydrogenase large subunit C-terminal domain-containing protein [Erysipelotrichaceae bacterium]|nr:[Fe-Fe] hydrogenase large subunit C-terminal domain-containing protein [Erysipelotrichaceae bacterium]
MNRKSAVTYTLSRCVKCLKCVKACPTSALTMEKSRIHVNQERCINCGQCIRACHSRGLIAQGSTLDDIASYDYTVCMLPSSLSSSCASIEEAEELFYAIKSLGFDEVVDLSPLEGQLMEETWRIASEMNEGGGIASFCPVVNRLVETTYPMLMEHMIPLNYPSEIMARQIRKRPGGDKIGIFLFCECESKLTLAKYPYGGQHYETDHAVALVDIFPKIKKNMKKGKINVTLCREGLQSCNPAVMMQRPDYLIADGYDKINSILNMEEFGLLDMFKLLYLFPCFNGCIGGHLLWGNSYLNRNNIDELTGKRRLPVTDLPLEVLYGTVINERKDGRSFKEKMQYFNRVNEVLEHLPGYDCSACGMQTCRIMAEEIAKGRKNVSDCRVLAAIKGGSDDNPTAD